MITAVKKCTGLPFRLKRCSSTPFRLGLNCGACIAPGTVVDLPGVERILQWAQYNNVVTGCTGVTIGSSVFPDFDFPRAVTICPVEPAERGRQFLARILYTMPRGLRVRFKGGNETVYPSRLLFGSNIAPQVVHTTTPAQASAGVTTCATVSGVRDVTITVPNFQTQSWTASVESHFSLSDSEVDLTWSAGVGRIQIISWTEL